MVLADAPTLEPLAHGTGYRVRVRYGKARIRIPTTDRDLATARAAVLVDLGAPLGDVPPELARDLLEKAGATDSTPTRSKPGALRRRTFRGSRCTSTRKSATFA
jgi:hypothetical protein